MQILSIIAGGLCALVLLILASSISPLQTSAAQIEQPRSSQPALPIPPQSAPPQEPEITAPDLGGIQAASRNFYTQIHFARTALKDPTLLSPDRKHLYSNVGYGLLGQIIEGITGQPYGDYCGTTIMAPAGATSAQIGGPMWATGGFGGWTITASDYARFVMYWYAADRPWVKTPQNYPLDRDSGMGLSVRNFYYDGRHMFYHSGLWQNNKQSRQIGALFLASTTGTVFVANWQGNLPPEAYNDLRQSITAVLH